MALGEETKAKAIVLLQLRRGKTKWVRVCGVLKAEKAAQGELSRDRQKVTLMSHTENWVVHVLSKDCTGEIPPLLVGVGFSRYLEKKNFLRLAREKEWCLFAWSYILWVAKSHLPQASPGECAAEASIKLEAKPVSRAFLPWWNWVWYNIRLVVVH